MLMIAGIANLARRRPVGAMPNGLPAFVFAVEGLDGDFKINDLFLL